MTTCSVGTRVRRWIVGLGAVVALNIAPATSLALPLSGSATFDSDYGTADGGEIAIAWEVTQENGMYRWQYRLTNISFGGDDGVSGFALSFGLVPYTGEMKSIMQPNGWSAKRYSCSSSSCEWPNDIEWFILGAGIEPSQTSMEQTDVLQTLALENGTDNSGIFEFSTEPRSPTEIWFLAFSGGGWAGETPPTQATSILDLTFGESGFASPTSLPGPGRLLPETGGVPEPGTLFLVAPALLAAGFLRTGRKRKGRDSD